MYLVRYSPPVNRMTNRCKNITLAKTSFRPVKSAVKGWMLSKKLDFYVFDLSGNAAHFRCGCMFKHNQSPNHLTICTKYNALNRTNLFCRTFGVKLRRSWTEEQLALPTTKHLQADLEISRAVPRSQTQLYLAKEIL